MGQEVKPAVLWSVMGINFFTSLSIVLLNKFIFKRFNVGPIRLIAFHQACTAFFGYVWHLCGGFAFKKVQIVKVLPLAMYFCGYVLFTNMSLKVNTVGTYQILKILTDPLIVFIEQYFYGTKYSFKIKMSLVPMVMGVFINSFFDLQFSVMGIFWGALGIVCTALYGINCGRKQHELELSSPQLLMYQAPLSTIAFAILIGLEELNGYGAPAATDAATNYTMGTGDVMMVVSTGIVAYLVNWSSFWVIGKTSIVTFAVFSKMKLITTLVVGFVMFGDSMNPKQFCGIILTLAGVAYYTYLKVQEKMAKERGSRPDEENDKVRLLSKDDKEED